MRDRRLAHTYDIFLLFWENKVIYSILEKASIDYNVYNSEKTYSGKNTNSTISLIEKDNKIYNIIKYIIKYNQ